MTELKQLKKENTELTKKVESLQEKHESDLFGQREAKEQEEQEKRRQKEQEIREAKKEADDDIPLE